MATNPDEAHLVKDLYRLQGVLSSRLPVDFALETAALEKEETQRKLFTKELECSEQAETIKTLRLQQRRVKEAVTEQADAYNTSIQSALHDAAEREKASVRAFRENQVRDLLDQPKEV